MPGKLPRLLLVFSAVILGAGAFMHASAFGKIQSALGASDLVPFAANSLRVLWLADSATSIFVAACFAMAALKPATATRWLVVVLALVPVATAALIYYFMGSFIGGHIQLAAGVFALIGGIQYPGTRSRA